MEKIEWNNPRKERIALEILFPKYERPEVVIGPLDCQSSTTVNLNSTKMFKTPLRRMRALFLLKPFRDRIGYFGKKFVGGNHKGKV